jgi:hypothetical protein
MEKDKLAYMSSDMATVFNDNFCMSAWRDNRCIGAAGLVQLHPHYAMAWALLSARVGHRDLIAIVRKIRYVLDTTSYRRVEMRVRYDYEQGHQFARLLGFKVEADKLKFAGYDGGDETLYARIKG